MRKARSAHCSRDRRKALCALTATTLKAAGLKQRLSGAIFGIGSIPATASGRWPDCGRYPRGSLPEVTLNGSPERHPMMPPERHPLAIVRNTRWPIVSREARS